MKRGIITLLLAVVMLMAAGAANAALIEGTMGADVLYGTDGADVIAGLRGNDMIDPGKGYDLVLGGGGRDRIIVVADGRDRVRCGARIDYVSATHGKDAVARNCEIVTWTPPEGTGGDDD